MDDDKKYIDEEGVEWRREFHSPQLNTQGSIDPWSERDFVDKTNRPGKLKDLWDRSRELSEKRADEAGGLDPVKEKKYKEYSKKRHGAVHPDKMKKTFENKHVKIDLEPGDTV